MSRCTRTLLAAVAALAVAVVPATPAAACGGLVGRNGSIRLGRTATLAAWHDGVEHYVTSFEFTGTGESVGSIIPLPGVPTDVAAAGRWTLQRLQQEVTPQRGQLLESRSDVAASTAGAQVLLETEVDALDITVLRGGGDDVGRWALDNGFFLTPDAPEVLDFYASRSTIFLAARFDAQRAAEQGLGGGDSTPIHVTIPLEQPWVPLRILGLGLPAQDGVRADVFLLTDDRPTLLAGGDGLRLNRSEQASAALLSDLRSDRGMGWVPDGLWLTHLALDEEAGDLTYDLSVGADGRPPTRRAAGLLAGADGTVVSERPRDQTWFVGAAAVGMAVAGSAVVVLRRRRPRVDR